MRSLSLYRFVTLTMLIAFCGTLPAAAETGIHIPRDASVLETLAAREAVVYVYLTSGERLPIRRGAEEPLRDAIVVARKDRLLLGKTLGNADLRTDLATLGPQQFILRTVTADTGRVLFIVGGDDVGTLYGAYRFAETLGVRFYLHGDVVPDGKRAWTLPDLNDWGKPNFELRGILPFHDFGEGPDWWNTDDYRAIISQLPKMRMNFIGLHTYPERNPVTGPEATVWHGLKDMIDESGRVRHGYPAGYMTTQRGWRITPMKTSAFTCGASQLFETEAWGSPVLDGYMTWPETPDDSAEVFNRVGDMFNAAFTHAQRLSVKTCLGTEVPLSIPKKLAEHIRGQGTHVAEPKVIRKGAPYDLDVHAPDIVRQVYEGTFERIKRCHPLDYFWLWTEEFWLGERPIVEVDAVTEDLLLAVDAAKAVDAPFTLATCGWVLGPSQDRRLFDQTLPKEIPFSCINRGVGKEPVEPQFAELTGRPKWAIPWLEDDPNLEGVQLWAGRVIRDAVDAYRYECTGLMGIHWRTEILSPNVAALAGAAWDKDLARAGVSSGETDPSARDAIQGAKVEFYRDWAQAHFGKNAGDRIVDIFTSLDGEMPEPSHGIGRIRFNNSPWEKESQKYAFVEKLEELRPTVQGAGNLERFEYWLNSFRYLKAMARLGCTAGQFKDAMNEVKTEDDPDRKASIARQKALPLRIQAARDWEEMMTCMLMTVNSPGAMGTVSDLEQVARTEPFMPGAESDQDLADVLGQPLPPEAAVSGTYRGKARIIVPTVRSLVSPGESLVLKVILLIPEADKGDGTVPSGALYWRPLGQGSYREIPLTHVARGVFQVTIPPLPKGVDAIEYYISASSGVTKLIYPATAPDTNRTVVRFG